MTRRLCLPALLLLGWVPPAWGQSPDVAADDQRIVQQEKQSSELMANLEYLCDNIGARLTGSAALRQANEWAAQKMRECGLENVHQESWTIPQGWERGRLEAEVLEPHRQPLAAALAAWSPGTRGTVTGAVVVLNLPPPGADAAEAKAALEKYHGKLRSAIVLMSAPPYVNEHPSINPPGSVRGFVGGTLEQPAPQQPGSQPPVARQPRQGRRLDAAAASAREQFLKREGVAAILSDAGKPQMLLNMSGSWMASGGRRLVPRLFVAHEHYAMLWRLAKRDTPVTVRLRAEGRFVKGPVTCYNTVGEMRGSDRPDEVVVCGAHLDSWDLGTGAVDNGTGSAAVLETARVLRSLGLKPRRTIRFVLFGGEEEGLVGSREYVKQHQAEMAKTSAVFVHDTGTGKVTGIGLHGNPQVQPVLEAMPALKDLGVTHYNPMIMGGTDHASFYASGVPAFWFMQDSADYNWMHHTQSDTFDKVLAEDMVQGATVMAVCAYNVAMLPDMLPRRAAAGGTQP